MVPQRLVIRVASAAFALAVVAGNAVPALAAQWVPGFYGPGGGWHPGHWVGGPGGPPPEGEGGPPPGYGPGRVWIRGFYGPGGGWHPGHWAPG